MAESTHAYHASTIAVPASTTKSEWEDLTWDDLCLIRDSPAQLRHKVCSDLHLNPELTARALGNFYKYDAAVKELKTTFDTHKMAGVLATAAAHARGAGGDEGPFVYDLYGDHAYKADGWLTEAFRKFDLACGDLEECPAELV